MKSKPQELRKLSNKELEELEALNNIKMYECKICDFKGTRPSVRKHIRKEHFWKGQKSLSEQMKSYKFK